MKLTFKIPRKDFVSNKGFNKPPTAGNCLTNKPRAAVIIESSNHSFFNRSFLWLFKRFNSGIQLQKDDSTLPGRSIAVGDTAGGSIAVGDTAGGSIVVGGSIAVGCGLIYNNWNWTLLILQYVASLYIDHFEIDKVDIL